VDTRPFFLKDDTRSRPEKIIHVLFIDTFLLQLFSDEHIVPPSGQHNQVIRLYDCNTQLSLVIYKHIYTIRYNETHHYEITNFEYQSIVKRRINLSKQNKMKYRGVAPACLFGRRKEVEYYHHYI
jgi:hypothetical protein